MKLHRAGLRASVVSLVLGALAVAVLGTGLGGCATVFIGKYKVMVDALTDPDKPPSTAKSYRLVANRSMISQTSVQIPAVVHCVNAALSGKGMYEAPAGVPSEIFIDVSFGTGTSPRGDPTVKEVFLQLSARGNAAKALDQSSEDEIWNVRVAVDGVSGRVESTMPLLATVAADHIGTDTQAEVQVDVLKNSPNIEATRQAAMKSLHSLNERIAAPSNAGESEAK